MGVEVVTFGCRLNAVESEAVKARAAEAGLADLVVFNTCAVTAEAVTQARQAIRRLRRERPAATLVVTGCAAQVDPGLFAAMPEVDRVVGNAEKTLPGTWDPARWDGAEALPRIEVADIMQVRATAPHLAAGFGDRTRGFLEVQNGCDHRCTFCIIPYGRGTSRSVPMGAVVDAVRGLVAAGRREVVLTGVDLTSYGADLPGQPRLGALVRTILRHVPELPRLRLSSIDSIEADPDLLAALAGEERLMPHLHLSLQAGDDLVLKRMKRRHTRADAVRFCGTVRRLRPDVVFGADVIAGFPTEDEAMFARSLDLVEECGLTFLHVFPFSPRPGTPAARMPQVARATVKERASRLRAAGEAALARYLAAQVGRTHRVLAERGGTGRTEGHALVRLGEAVEPGRIVDTLIAGHDGRALLAA
ncbi:MAG: tRNA (N(6)-L-threonylcarbamoyladenosine(37)-C(2))-methylthiotransferase MtaB [Alsobacter sp.]